MRATRRRTVRIAVHSAKQRPTPQQPVDLGVDDLASRLRFSFDSGHIWLGESRMLLLHGAALTALRKELIDSLGVDRARGMLLRIGYASGARDARWARTLYPAASDTELLGIGPALHMLEGVVRCTPDRMELDIEHGKFHGEFTWHASFEADAHVQLFGQSTEPVCWMQLGYASGYSSALMGCFIHYRETQCAAAGAPCCRITGRPAHEWPDAEAELRYFQPDPVTDHILALQDRLQSLRYAIDHDLHTDDLVGASPGFKQAASLLKRAAHSSRAPAASSAPPAARCSSTRSASCRPRRSPSCCARCRKARSSASATRARARSTCAWSRRPMSTWSRRCRSGASARTCSTASTSTR